MAFSNTYDTTSPGSAVGNREDLSSSVYELAPQETPIISLATKVKATGTLHEWTVDELAAPVTTAIAEGADVTAYDDKFEARARLGNYVHERRRSFMVSKRQQAVESVGPAKLAQAETKAIKEIKRDGEAIVNGGRWRRHGVHLPWAW
jgi:hypothetical protein